MNEQLLRLAMNKIAIIKTRGDRLTTAEMEAQLKLPRIEVGKILTHLGYEEVYIKVGRHTYKTWRKRLPQKQVARG